MAWTRCNSVAYRRWCLGKYAWFRRLANEQMRSASSEEQMGAELVNKFLMSMREDLPKLRGARKFVDVEREGTPRFPEEFRRENVIPDEVDGPGGVDDDVGLLEPDSDDDEQCVAQLAAQDVLRATYEIILVENVDAASQVSVSEPEPAPSVGEWTQIRDPLNPRKNSAQHVVYD